MLREQIFPDTPDLSLEGLAVSYGLLYKCLLSLAQYGHRLSHLGDGER
jgi:hypothetical protein